MKTLTHTLLPILMLALVPMAQAQRIHAFVTSGLTLSQIEGDELKGFRQTGNTSGVGALAALNNSRTLGLSIEALFSQRGAYNSYGEPYVGRITLNYVDIPLLLHFQDRRGGMLVGAGLVYGRLVQQPHGTLKYNPNIFIPDTTDMEFAKHDLSAALDFRFTVWRGLQFNFRFQHSLLPVKRDWHFIDKLGQQERHIYRNAYNQSIALRLIWQF